MRSFIDIFSVLLRSNMRKGVNSFVDRHADDSVERTRDVESRGGRKLKDDDNPPYDFSGALGASGKHS